MNDWMRRAACATADPDIFFPQRQGNSTSYSKARQICSRCSVTRECLESALAEHVSQGMYGGLTPKERKALVTRRRKAS